MNLHEYQAKQLLAQYGVTIPTGDVCDTPEAAKAIAEKLLAAGDTLIAVKSQIHAGGRGKGTFKSGFQGGVKLCKTAEDVFEKAKAMLGNVLVTKQTGAEGRLVSKLLIAGAPKIEKELYLAVLLDRANSRPVVMASTEGGMDIEEVAAKNVHQDPFHMRILQNNLESRTDLFLACSAAHIEEIRGLPAKMLNDVHRRHRESRAIYKAGN